MRKLASVKRVDDIIPIEGADAIELCVIGGWQAIVKKGEYQQYDLVVYCEADSFLPIKEQYEFLRKSSYKTMWDGTEGFRLKTMRMRGVLSQGLVLPLKEATAAYYDWQEQIQAPLPPPNWDEGDDVTDLLEIKKWDTPPAGIYQGQGKGSLPLNAKGKFPDWLPRTDEERIQNCWNTLPKDIAYVETEKLHGTSATFYLKDGEFGICSRNLDLKIEEGGLYAEIANELDIENKLRTFWQHRDPIHGIAIQGEIIGEGINQNYNHIERRQFFVFNFFDESNCGYASHAETVRITKELGLQHVPVVNEKYVLPKTCAEALTNVEGPSLIGKQPIREGSVIRHTLPYGRRISAKIVSNLYLLKEK